MKFVQTKLYNCSNTLLNKSPHSPSVAILYLLLTTLLSVSCKEQPPLILNNGEVLNELHQNNIGRIAFMKDWVPFDEFTNADFKKELELTTSSDFGFRMFLEKTLTAYLSDLEPNLTVEELCEKGNFQLKFYVDDNPVYTYNLQPGAGSCDYKNSATVYGVPLANKEEPDHWGRFLWTRFMRAEGGQKALSNGPHDFKLEIRPYFENEELKVGNIIAQGETKLSMVEKELDEGQIAIQEIQPTNKWTISSESYDTTLIRQLNKKIALDYFKDVTSITVAKNGKLLIEEYFNNANRNTLHDTRSVGKTLTSTVLGIAIKEGHIKNEDLTLKEFYDLPSFENYTKNKGNVSLKSLLTMSSGFDGSDMDYNSPGNEENMYPTTDWVKFGLDLPMDNEKQIGENWDYFTAGVVVLGDILNKTIPGGLENYADDKLFKPLGINDYTWQYTPSKVPNTAGGFQMSSLDNAKYGQLYLDNGEYQGTKILDSDWVQKTLSHQVEIPNTINEHYGYLVWNKTYSVKGNDYEAYYASGNGGNKIMIFQDLGVVIVITAKAYGRAYMHVQADEIVQDYLLPSLIK